MSSVRQRDRSLPREPGEDRRVRKTKAALTHALLDLVTEKGYRGFTVQALLDRADVGRSTFYSHYRGRDDLLIRSFRRMLSGLDRCLDRDPGSRRVAPVRELFRHVGESRRFHRALVRAHMLERLFEAGVEYFARAIGERLAAVSREPRGPRVPVEIRARTAAGGLFALLAWWLEEDGPPSPERMDDLFHAMVVEDGDA